MSTKNQPIKTIDPFDHQEVVKSEEWSWREIHIQFFLCTVPLPLFFLTIGILKYDECDIYLATWMIIMGVLMAIEVVYLAVYFQRRTLETKSELDLEDDIFEHYHIQKLNDPMLQRAIRLHMKIGFLSFFGVVECYFTTISDTYCSSLVFWPSLLISLFYCISLVLLVFFTNCKSRPQKHIV